jgi:hypothetical protein
MRTEMPWAVGTRIMGSPTACSWRPPRLDLLSLIRLSCAQHRAWLSHELRSRSRAVALVPRLSSISLQFLSFQAAPAALM